MSQFQGVAAQIGQPALIRVDLGQGEKEPSKRGIGPMMLARPRIEWRSQGLAGGLGR